MRETNQEVFSCNVIWNFSFKTNTEVLLWMYEEVFKIFPICYEN